MKDLWTFTPAEAGTMRIVQQLRELREKAGLTQAGLSLMCGFGKGTINHYETGIIVSPILTRLIEWADALNCDVVIVPRETAPVASDTCQDGS